MGSIICSKKDTFLGKNGRMLKTSMNILDAYGMQDLMDVDAYDMCLYE